MKGAVKTGIIFLIIGVVLNGLFFIQGYTNGHQGQFATGLAYILPPIPFALFFPTLYFVPDGYYLWLFLLLSLVSYFALGCLISWIYDKIRHKPLK